MHGSLLLYFVFSAGLDGCIRPCLRRWKDYKIA